MNNKSFIKTILYRTGFICLVFVYCLAMCNNYTDKTNVVSNADGARSIQAVNMITKYDAMVKAQAPKHVETMAEARELGPLQPISFTGQMTAYRPNCKGCGGRVSCPPRQDVRNGNIYYNDTEYGQIRILAADPAIPCGTIVKVTNVTFSQEPIIGIVLDRGGAIKGNIMDFLVTENDNMDIIGRQRNVNYEILRWGW